MNTAGKGAGPVDQELVRDQKWRRSSAEAGVAVTVNFRPLVKVIIFPNLLPAFTACCGNQPSDKSGNARLVPGGSLWEQDLNYPMNKEFDQRNSLIRQKFF